LRNTEREVEGRVAMAEGGVPGFMVERVWSRVSMKSYIVAWLVFYQFHRNGDNVEGGNLQ